MITEACGISSYIEKLALSDTAVVHSVYERTINIALSSSALLAIQKESSPVSPLTLLAGDDSIVFSGSLYIAPGMEVHITSDLGKGKLISIEMAGLTMVIPGDAPRFDTEVPAALSPADYLAFESSVNVMQIKSNASGDLIDQRAAQIKEKTRELFRDSKIDEAALCLTDLIGLGGGLTPAGDDFVTGVISGIHSVSKMPLPADSHITSEELGLFRKALFDEVSGRSSDTNDISSAFLSASLDGQTSLPLKSFLIRPSHESIRDISRIGHTSGMDALEGLLFFFKLLSHQ